MKVVTILGTRPEIIKCYPLFDLLDQNFKHLILHTGQHFSFNMDKVFFKELGVKSKVIRLKSNTGDFGTQLSDLIYKIYHKLEKLKADCVIVQGDTNTALAGALVAARLKIKLIHLEAGCRSGNKYSPEEQNRILIDSISDFHFCSDQNSFINLKKNKFHHNSFVVGSTLFDSLYKVRNKIEKINIVDHGLRKQDFVLFTLHRVENVSDKNTLSEKINFINYISEKIPVLFPVHPRTLSSLKEFDIKLSDKVLAVKPMSYFKFLGYLKHSKFVITDSGGLQEEAVFFNIPCIILRNETEWTRLIKIKKNFLFPKVNNSLYQLVDRLLADNAFCKEVSSIVCVESKPGASEKIILILKNLKLELTI